MRPVLKQITIREEDDSWTELTLLLSQDCSLLQKKQLSESVKGCLEKLDWDRAYHSVPHQKCWFVNRILQIFLVQPLIDKVSQHITQI